MSILFSLFPIHAMESGNSRRCSRPGNGLDRRGDITLAKSWISITFKLWCQRNSRREDDANEIRTAHLILTPDKHYSFAAFKSEKFNPCAINPCGADILVEYQHPDCVFQRDPAPLLQIDLDYIARRILGETCSAGKRQSDHDQMAFDYPFCERIMKTNWGMPRHLMKGL